MQVIKIISLSDIGKRLDHYLTLKLKKYSRSQIQSWIRSGNVLVNNKTCKTGYPLELNDCININIPELKSDHGFIKPEPINLNILHEDDEIIVINKPPRLVVHPGRGNQTGTLVNGLLGYNENLAALPRAGIVHRLDKNTSGLLITAKNEITYLDLVKQIQQRSVIKKYLAFSLCIKNLSNQAFKVLS